MTTQAQISIVGGGLLIAFCFYLLNEFKRKNELKKIPIRINKNKKDKKV